MEASESKCGQLVVSEIKWGQVVVSESIAIWSSDGNQSKLMNLDPETSIFEFAKLIFLNTRLGGNWSNSSIVNVSVFSKHIFI